MIKGVIFDLDDTLISEKEYIKSGFKVVCNVISEQHNLNFDTVYQKIFELFDEDSDYVFNRLLDCFNIEYEKEYILELLKIYRGHSPDISLYSDAEEILNYLAGKNYKLGIITDGYKITQNKKLESLDIDSCFDCIIITDELGKDYWKPHKKPYKLCSNNLGVDYSSLIYVGDNIKKDFITANKLGMHTVQIVREEGVYKDLDSIEESYKADHVISDLNELKEIYDL